MSEESGKVESEQASSNGTNEATAAAAAFANARGESPSEPAKVVTENPEIQDKQVLETSPPKLIAGKTEEEVIALLNEIPSMKESYRKQIDNLAGNYGKLNVAFQKLQQETPTGESVEMTDEDMAELKAEWPEFAAMTKNALNKVLGRLKLKGTSQQSQTPEEFTSLAKKAANEVVSEERIKMHTEILHGLRPGWEKVIGLPDAEGKAPETEYRKWLVAQPDEYQTKISNSNNAFEIGASIDAFNQAKAASSKKQEQNKQRLANAVQPEGQVAARGVISEQSAADKAFNARRQRT